MGETNCTHQFGPRDFVREEKRVRSAVGLANIGSHVL